MTRSSDLRAPDWLPRDAIDCHVHVIDPAQYAYVAGSGYHPHEGETGDAHALTCVLDQHGITNALLVQPSCYSNDNTAMIDAIGKRPENFKGVAVVDASREADKLDQLVAAGIVGIRFNAVNMGSNILACASTLFTQLNKLNLFAEIQCRAPQLTAFNHLIRESNVTLVFDHLGYPDVKQGIEEPGFQQVLQLGREGRAFVKLSGAFRLSQAPWPHADVDPFVAAVVDAFGSERCMWGSDWPFIGVAHRPSYRSVLDLLARWLPRDVDRFNVLVDTPTQWLQASNIGVAK